MKIVIAGGLIPIALAIYTFGMLHLFWSSLFLLSVGLTIISLAAPSKFTLYLLVASAILFVVSYFAEPRRLELVLASIS